MNPFEIKLKSPAATTCAVRGQKACFHGNFDPPYMLSSATSAAQIPTMATIGLPQMSIIPRRKKAHLKDSVPLASKARWIK